MEDEKWLAFERDKSNGIQNRGRNAYIQSYTSPFQTREALPFPAVPYRPLSLGFPLGEEARRILNYSKTLYHMFYKGQP